MENQSLNNLVEKCRLGMRYGKALKNILPANLEKKLKERYSKFIDSFDKDGFLTQSIHEITSPETPRPYLHLLCNLHDKLESIYGSFWSNTGLGFSCIDSVRAGQITSNTDNSYVPTSPSQNDARLFILREENSKGAFINEKGKRFDAWYFLPQNSAVSKYSSRQTVEGIITVSVQKDIKASLSVHVAIEEPVEIWQMELTNLSNKKRNLNLFCKVNWDLRTYPGYYNDNRVTSFAQYFNEFNGIAAYNMDSKNKNPRAAFIICDQKPTSFDLAQEIFHGSGANRIWPKAVELGKCSNSLGNQPYSGLIGAMCFNVNLGAKAKKVFLFALGKISVDKKKSNSEISAYKKQFLSSSSFKKEIERISERWREFVSKNMAKTPDKEFDCFYNVWLKYQARNTSRFTRALDKVGFRDILQDLIGIMDFNIEYVKPALLRTLQYQLRDGRALRQYCLFKDCEHDERMYMDSSIWTIDTVSSYIKETGDLSLLEEKVGFYDPYRKIIDDSKPASIYDHCFFVIKCLYELRGRFGLCKIGYGDWNDALDGLGRGGSGVSVWLSHALIYASILYREFAELKNDVKRVKYINEVLENMTSNLANYGWNESHYIYAFSDEGLPVGANKCSEGKIHLNSNSWALFNGVAKNSNCHKTLLKTLESMNTPIGYELISLPYTKEKSQWVGRIADIVPGLFENGSIYSHGHAFMIYAFCTMGMGDKAYEELKKILPESTLPDISTGPLHQIPNTVAGRTHPLFGMHLYNNFTGAITWLRRACQRMLGIIPEFNGFRIWPCIPKIWKEYEVRRIFRGVDYHIFVKNPKNLECGVKSVSVNGNAISADKAGNFIIQPVKGSSNVKINVEMG